MKEERLKTLSLYYFDDEILYKDTNGDIHLKDGVHRLTYGTFNDPFVLESHINDIDYKITKRNNKIKELYTKEDGVTEY